MAMATIVHDYRWLLFFARFCCCCGNRWCLYGNAVVCMSLQAVQDGSQRPGMFAATCCCCLFLVLFLQVKVKKAGGSNRAKSKVKVSVEEEKSCGPPQPPPSNNQPACVWPLSEQTRQGLLSQTQLLRGQMRVSCPLRSLVAQ